MSALSSSSNASKQNASKHRRQAAVCEILATHARSTADRELLLRVQCVLQRHACYEDWVAGRPPIPPTRPTKMFVVHRT
jgi:hypothetical protein